MPNVTTTQKKWLITAGLCLLVLAAYARVTDCAFVTYDDDAYMTANAHVQSGLNWRNLVWALTATQAANWHPITWISHIIDFQIYGLNPAGHHITNLIIHAANVVLLFRMLQYMTGALWRSALVASLFAVHPLNVESVAWVAERKNVLSTLFWILTLWAYAWYAIKPDWRRYLLVIASFVFGLMSKPMLVTLPFVLLLLDYWPLRRLPQVLMPVAPDAEKPQKPVRKGKLGETAPAFVPRSNATLILEKITLLVLAIASSIITIIAQREGKAVGNLQTYPLAVRLENALVSYAAYLWQMIWPAGLGVFYPHPRAWLPVWQVALGAIVFLALTGVCIWGFKRFPFLPVGWFWYLGTLVPVIGLVQVGWQSRADRYTYVPLIGVFILIAWLLNELVKRLPSAQTGVTTVMAVALVACVLITQTQIGYWHDSVALFARAVDVTRNNYVAENNLGEALALQGKNDEAEKAFSSALSINPNFSLALANLGMFRVQSGNFDDAIDLFSQAVKQDPAFADAYNRLGAALLQKDRLDEAEESLHKAMELNPRLASAYANMGALFEKRGKPDEAIEAYANAMQFSQVNTLTAQMHYKTGLLLEKKGDNQGALFHYREAARLRPDSAMAQQSLRQLLDKMKSK